MAMRCLARRARALPNWDPAPTRKGRGQHHRSPPEGPDSLALPRRAVGAYRGTGTPGGQRSCRIALASALLFPEPYW
jgi:hypothetical protein